MDRCDKGEITHGGSTPETLDENLDGYKFFVGQGEWIMVRASGTEPVLSVYGQSTDYVKTRELIETEKITVLKQ